MSRLLFCIARQVRNHFRRGTAESEHSLIMLSIENLNEHGLHFVIMGINDIISRNMKVSETYGLYVGNVWLTPETCYWLYKLLENKKGSCLVSNEVLEALKNGTNHPETL